MQHLLFDGGRGYNQGKKLRCEFLRAFSMFQWFKKKTFNIFGFPSVVNGQIDRYLRFKKEYSEATENEILNMLLTSRIKLGSTVRLFPSKEQELYYEQLLKDNEKTLDDVIFHIVWYEYIASREDWVIEHYTRKELTIFEIQVEEYISNQIKGKVRGK